MNNGYQPFAQVKKEDKIIIFFGPNEVGKTSILQQFTKNIFDENYQTTLGINYYIKEMDSIRLSIWDTCGEEIYNNNDFVPNHLYKSTVCYVIVLSYNSKESLDDSLLYIDYIKQHIIRQNTEQNPYLIALINKKDLKEKQYNLNTAVKCLKEHSPNLLIGEISAKDGIGVQKFFRKLESLLTNGNFEVNENNDELFFVSTFKINEEEGEKAPKKKKCCD